MKEGWNDLFQLHNSVDTSGNFQSTHHPQMCNFMMEGAEQRRAPLAGSEHTTVSAREAFQWLFAHILRQCQIRHITIEIGER